MSGAFDSHAFNNDAFDTGELAPPPAAGPVVPGAHVFIAPRPRKKMRAHGAGTSHDTARLSIFRIRLMSAAGAGASDGQARLTRARRLRAAGPGKTLDLASLSIWHSEAWHAQRAANEALLLF